MKRLKCASLFALLFATSNASRVQAGEACVISAEIAVEMTEHVSFLSCLTSGGMNPFACTIAGYLKNPAAKAVAIEIAGRTCNLLVERLGRDRVRVTVTGPKAGTDEAAKVIETAAKAYRTKTGKPGELKIEKK